MTRYRIYHRHSGAWHIYDTHTSKDDVMSSLLSFARSNIQAVALVRGGELDSAMMRWGDLTIHQLARLVRFGEGIFFERSPATTNPTE